MRMNKRALLILIILTCVIAYAMVAVSPRAEGSPVVVVAQFHISGTINGDSYTEDGSMTEDSGTGIASVTGVFSKIPSGYHPFCLGGCDKCTTCTWNAPAYHGAASIDTITDGNFNAMRYVTIKDHTGATIGSITVDPIHFRKVSETQYTMDAEINGWYSGPTDIVNVGNYEMLLRQKAHGEITGTYTQSILRSGGPPLTLIADTLYTYSGDKVLPFDEAKTVDLSDITLVGLTYSFNVRSAYDPWTVGGVVVPVDKFGLLAPYIALASIILVATAIYFKRVKRRKEEQ
jgi:hypothetical protein